MRKTKHWLVTAALLLCSISVSAHDFEVDGIYYRIVSESDLTVEVTYRGSRFNEFSNTYSGNIVIPSTVIYNNNKYCVVGVEDDTFRCCHTLASVVISEGVKSIKGAFSSCFSVTSVALPQSLTELEDWAFYDCSSLVSVNIPNGLTDIGMWAFGGCSSLTSIVIPESVTNIGEQAFYNCGSLSSIVVAEGNMKYDSRDNCNAIIETSNNVLLVGCCSSFVPESVESISGYAFYFCTELSSIDIPKSVTYIAECAFYGCHNLSSIVVDENNAVYDSRGNCNAIIETATNKLVTGCSTTIVPDDVTCIGCHAFAECGGLTSIAVPNSVTKIESRAFYGCFNLSEITLSKNLQDIGDDAFCNCSSLISLTIPKGITSIKGYTFYGCCNLESITLPEGVTSIGVAAFAWCEKMHSLILPGSLIKIENGALDCCYNLSTIVCKALVPPALGTTYIYSNSEISLYVPLSSLSTYQAAEYWSEFSIESIPMSEITLTDGEEFCQDEIKDYKSITYTRTFNNTNWQALYVPFEIPYENIKDDFEVAYINDTRQYDRDDDGVKEETVIEAFKITSGTLEANYPYLIRAKETGEKTITVTDAMLYTTEENYIDCSSVYDKYIFTGTYSRMSGTELTGCYALSGGIWQPVAEDASLGAFRFYLQIESRNGNAQAAQSIKMRVIGEETDGDATSIDDVESAGNEQIVYDLAGRRVAKPTKGVYIVNGKKVLYN